MNSNRKKLEKALLDKAVGYTTKEVIEEYGYNGEDFVLQKRKVSEKSYPPDMSAIQMLLDSGENSIESMTDEELASEKMRLLKLLKEKEKNECKRSK